MEAFKPISKKRKSIFLILGFVIFNLKLNSQNLNIDSLYYYDLDTVGIASEIIKDENNWRWTDTLIYKDFSKLDSIAKSVGNKFKSIDVLAKKLTEGIENTEDKIRIIFSWVGFNICYDYDEYMKKDKDRKNIQPARYSKNASKQEKEAAWEKSYFIYATNVLRKNKGICEGYSTLFFELWKSAGIECKVIHGKANISKNEKTKKLGSHAWNAVKIDGEWYYLDVTWASFNTYEKGKYSYYTNLNNNYYLTHSDKLFDTHIINENRTKSRNSLIGNR